MTFGYIRVSSDKQTVENQRFEINTYCERNGINIDGWVEETISGTKDPSKRELGKLLRKVKKDDVMICSEISRIGRSLFMIMGVLELCMKKECKVMTIKDNFKLGDDVQSKVLAFAFGLSAEIERNLISQRTKEALAKRKADGVVLGRPKGVPLKHESCKFYKSEHRIRLMYSRGVSVREMSKRLKCDRGALTRYIDKWMSDLEIHKV